MLDFLKALLHWQFVVGVLVGYIISPIINAGVKALLKKISG